MFFEPLTCCSIGAAIDCATTFALAPGNEVETSTCGGTICGYCEIGSPNTATPPASEMISEITAEKTGRSMKKLNMPTWRLCRQPARRLFGRHLFLLRLFSARLWYRHSSWRRPR